MIRLKEIVREAFRNTRSGTSRPLLAVITFLLSVGLLACLQASLILQRNQAAFDWRASGSSIKIVSATGAIDGFRCVSLNEIDGVAASAAFRTGSDVSLSVLPSNPIKLVEATWTAGRILRLADSANATGAWVASDLANTLKLSERGKPELAVIGGGTIPVSNIYPHVEDGRMPILSNTIVSTVPASGVFDSCWVEIWPESKELESLLLFPVIPDNLPPNSQPEIRQLNSSGGPSFLQKYGSSDFDCAFSAVAVALGAALGFILIRLRRLELASTLHAGIDKASLCLQSIIESLLWLTPGIAMSLGFLGLLSVTSNPEAPSTVFLPGLVVLLLGTFSVLVSTFGNTLAIKESQLFEFFKRR